MDRFVIKNATLYQNKSFLPTDVEIEKGRITKIQSNLESQNSYDAKNLTLIPACIDLNIQQNHFSQEGFKKLEEKAMRGGVGTLSLKIQPSMIDFLNFYNTQSSLSFLPSVLPYEDHHIQEISKLFHNGLKSLSLSSCVPNQALECIYHYAQMFSLPSFTSYSLLKNEIAYPSELSYKMGLSSYSSIIQEVESMRFIQFAQHFKAPTLLQGINEEKIVQKVFECPFVQSEVSIHHLLLNEEKIQNYNPWAKLNPPLCNLNAQEKLLSSIAKIDMLTSLHQEFSLASKEQTFEDASSGIDCLEFYFPLLYTYLVKTNHLSLEELIHKTSSAQSKLMQLNEGEIQIGKDAHFFLVDLEESFSISHPLYGEQTLFGKIKAFYSKKTGLQRIDECRTF